MSAKEKLAAAGAAKNGSKKSAKKIAQIPSEEPPLNQTELRLYEPEFSPNDPKWLLLGRWHVQKASAPICLITIIFSILFAIFGFLLFHSLPILFLSIWVVICVPLLIVSSLALFASVRAIPALLLPFIFFLFLLSILWFSLFFFLIPMAIFVPTFWTEWIQASMGIPQTAIWAIQSVTILFLILSLSLLILFTFLNFTVLRAHRFQNAKKSAYKKGIGGEIVRPPKKPKRDNQQKDNGTEKDEEKGSGEGRKKQVQMLETVT